MRSRPIRHRRIRRRGIALAEAILGGVLLAMGMTVVMSLGTRSLRVQVQGENRMTAAWLADDLLNMVVAHGPVDYDRTFETSGTFDAPFETFSYEVVLEDVGRGVPYQVAAIVRWGPRPNDVVRVDTLVAVHLGEEDEVPEREPFEEVDRDARWFGDEDA